MHNVDPITEYNNSLLLKLLNSATHVKIFYSTQYALLLPVLSFFVLRLDDVLKYSHIFLLGDELSFDRQVFD